MSIEDQIQSLAAHAAPLRELDDDDPAKQPLAGIVDEINQLRAVQERESREGPEPAAQIEGSDAMDSLGELSSDQPKRRGRPRKEAK